MLISVLFRVLQDCCLQSVIWRKAPAVDGDYDPDGSATVRYWLQHVQCYVNYTKNDNVALFSGSFGFKYNYILIIIFVIYKASTFNRIMLFTWQCGTIYSSMDGPCSALFLHGFGDPNQKNHQWSLIARFHVFGWALWRCCSDQTVTDLLSRLGFGWGRQNGGTTELFT